MSMRRRARAARNTDPSRSFYESKVAVDPFVYFVIAPRVSMLKIGTAENVAKRIAAIEGNSPIPVELFGMAIGGEQVERWCHAHCAIERSHYEWFAWNDRTQGFVEWFLGHGELAAEKLCARELKSDRLAAVGRRAITRIPALPTNKFRRRYGDDLSTYWKVVDDNATPLGGCECNSCKSGDSKLSWCGR